MLDRSTEPNIFDARHPELVETEPQPQRPRAEKGAEPSRSAPRIMHASSRTLAALSPGPGTPLRRLLPYTPLAVLLLWLLTNSGDGGRAPARHDTLSRPAATAVVPAAAHVATRAVTIARAPRQITSARRTAHPMASSVASPQAPSTEAPAAPAAPVSVASTAAPQVTDTAPAASVPSAAPSPPEKASAVNAEFGFER